MFYFLKFIKTHNKSYETVGEFEKRFEIFQENLTKVEDLEIFSPFMDQTTSEFSSTLILDLSNSAFLKATAERYVLQNSDAPDSYDWRTQGVIPAVKDQKSCGSCWAFSAISNIESLYAIKNKNIITLSEQQLVDCDKVDAGCQGGWMDNAFDFLTKNGGVMGDVDYAYKAVKSTCTFNQSKVKVQLNGFKDIDSNEETIKKVVFENGPLSVAVNATPFQFYTGGILTPTVQSCNPQQLNHGVVIVGYGSENGKNFWIIRNSWGAKWGEQGYIRLARGIGACGVNTHVSTSVLK